MNPLVWMAAGAVVQGIFLTVWWQPWKHVELVDPVGWDEAAGRCHDVMPQLNGKLLHFSTCWCRPRKSEDSSVSTP